MNCLAATGIEKYVLHRLQILNVRKYLSELNKPFEKVLEELVTFILITVIDNNNYKT